MSTASEPGALRAVKRNLRYRDWALSKIPILCVAGAYLCITHNLLTSNQCWRFFLFTFIFAVSNAVYGFLVNDLADQQIDKSHGKVNVFNNLGSKSFLKVLMLTVLVSIGSGMLLSTKADFIGLLVLSFLVSSAYSLQPFRLKERGFAGIACSTLAQSTLPMILLFRAFGVGSMLELALFTIASTAHGSTLELAHQLFDFERDSSTNTHTFAVELGKEKVNEIYSWMIWLDRTALGLMSCLVIFASLLYDDGIHLLAWSVTIPLLVFYFLSLVNLTVRTWYNEIIDPYYGQRTIIDRLCHDTIPNSILPIFLLALLAQAAPAWILVLIFFMFWRLLLPRL